MMRLILIILLSVLCNTISFSQYTIDRIVYDESAENDTLYSNNTDTLWRKNAEGAYMFAIKTRFRKFVNAAEITGGGQGGGDMLAENNLSDLIDAATARINLELGNINNTSDANKQVSTVQQTALDAKQATLVSATNIKTINGNSLLGSGDIAIAGGEGGEAFPVGFVFISVVATNPATLLGYGTWVAFGAGRVLVGINAADTDFDVAEETGGNKTVTIAADNLPQLTVAVTDPGHTHVQNKNTATTGALSGTTPDASTSTSAASGYLTASGTTGITATANTAGANTPINNIQPYITVYFWKRIL